MKKIFFIFSLLLLISNNMLFATDTKATPEFYHLWQQLQAENFNWDWTDPNDYPDYFYINNNPPIRCVYPFYDANLGVITEYGDFEAEDGWTLLYRDFGSPERYVKMPYFVLYNRNNGLMRIFIYVVTNESYSYLSIQTSFETNASANLNFVSKIAHALDKPSDYSSKKAIGHAPGADGHWVYSDIPISYDYNVSNLEHVDLIFDLKGVGVNGIKLDGTIDLQQKNQAIISTNENIVSEINGFGKFVGEKYDTWDKYRSRGETLFKSVGDFYGSIGRTNVKNKLYESANQIKGFPFGPFGAVFGIIDFFLGGGKHKEPTPLVFEGELHLSGTMTTEEIIGKLKMRVPGSKIPQYDYWSPVYDEPIGIFNLTQSPVFYRLKYDQLRVQENGVTIGTPWHSYKLVSDINYTINPNANVNLTEIKAAIVFTVEQSLVNKTTDFNLLLDWWDNELIKLESVKETKYKNESRTYFTFSTEYMTLSNLKNRYLNTPYIMNDAHDAYFDKVYIKIYARFTPKNNATAEPFVLVTKYQPEFYNVDNSQRGPWSFPIKAIAQNNKINLNWPHLFSDVYNTTDTLHIQKSLNGINWGTIYTVTDPSPNYRSYTDTPTTSGEFRYYRLKLTDKYGLSVTSEVFKISNPRFSPLALNISGPTFLD